MFKSDAKKIKKVFTMDLEETMKKYVSEGKKKDLPNPFDEALEGIDVLINTIGPTKMFNAEHTRLIDYETNRCLIDAAKKNGVEKFILVTSMLISRPGSFVAFMLNTFLSDCMAYKM